MFPYVSAAYQEAAFRGASQALRCVSRRPPKGAVEERISRSRLRSFNRCAARDWRPAPRDRRGVGRLPSRSALIWRTTRSRTGGAGAIETPTPGAVPGFIPVVGRYRTTATWRLSFHCGMNAADTSAWRGIRIGCVSAPRRDAVRTSPRSWPGAMRRLRTGTNPRFRALARAHARSPAGTRPACAARARPTQSHPQKDRHGLATYRRLDRDAELVTLDADPTGVGTGTAL